MQEQERLSVQDFGNLLNNPTFHKSLLGCAVEVVIATYGISGKRTLPFYRWGLEMWVGHNMY